MAERNWAGSHTYRARRLHRPATLEQLSAIVAAAPRIRVLGTRHAFNDIADSDELVTLAGLPAEVAVDRAAGRVSLSASMSYGELAMALDREGLALHNLASLPHTSVAGAVATATHGSGDGNGNLATAVRAVELVTSSGEPVRVARGDPDFDGVVIGLGALGAVTRLELEVEPAYAVRQRVYEGLAWEALHERFDEMTASGYSVSVFTSLGEVADQVWVKRRVSGAEEDAPPELFGARAATADHHPIAGLDPVNCTAQLGRPGPWWDRLPHFRMDFTPSSGEELQTELLLPRSRAHEGIEATRALASEIRPVLQVCEIRTIAADRLWMSPQYGRDTVGIHFTWCREPEAVLRVLARLEPALGELGARPHWGKVFLADAATLADRYERLPDFLALAERLDPRRAFRNEWLETRLLGG